MKNIPLFILMFLSFFILGNQEVDAAKKKKKSKKTPVQVNKYADFVIDSDSGEVLHEENADVKRYPASLTKLMTLYLTFDALKNGELQLKDMIKVSKNASSQQRMNLALKPGEWISVQNLISSLVVVSANDSSVVLAEKIGSTEVEFVKMMNAKAAELGMKSTNFTNPNGLFNAKQVTTARDMATLMLALKKDFPEYYDMLSKINFTYKGKSYSSHTAVMKVYPWAKAGKTGYVRASGFNVVIGAEKENKNLVAVVMGGKTAKLRDGMMVKLLDQCF